MPTYTYACNKCDHVFDVFHSMSAAPRVLCEQCKGRCTRQLGTGAGIIFKGSGFYETDFKTKKGAPPKETKSEGGAGGEKPEKSAAKAETKAEPAKKPAASAAASN